MRLKKSAVRVPREFRAHSVPYDRDYDQFVHSVLCRLTPQLDADPWLYSDDAPSSKHTTARQVVAVE